MEWLCIEGKYIMEISYITGLLATDGYNAKRKNGYFSVLELKDEQIIDDLCKVLKRPKRYRERIINNKLRKFYSVSLVKETMDILTTGQYLIDDRKNLYDYYNILDYNEKCNLIRGLFDGDGSISPIHKSNNLRFTYVLNSKHISIKKIIEDFFKEEFWNLSIYYDKRGNGVYNYNIGKQSNVEKIFKLLYQNKDCLKLNRKFEIFNNKWGNI